MLTEVKSILLTVWARFSIMEVSIPPLVVLHLVEMVRVLCLKISIGQGTISFVLPGKYGPRILPILDTFNMLQKKIPRRLRASLPSLPVILAVCTSEVKVSNKTLS